MRLGVVMGTQHGHEGTTGAVVAEAIDALSRTGDVTVDTVTTTDLDLGSSCPACLSCMTAGEQSCPSFDRATPARRVMDDADLVVFATPVHSFHVSATMKRFVDHFAYLIHRPAYVGKPAALVSTAAGAGHDEALGYLRTAIRRWGFHTVDQLGVNGPGLAKPPYRAKVDAAVTDFAATLRDAATNPVEPTGSATRSRRGWRTGSPPWSRRRSPRALPRDPPSPTGADRWTPWHDHRRHSALSPPLPATPPPRAGRHARTQPACPRERPRRPALRRTPRR